MLTTSITDQASLSSVWTSSIIGLVIYVIVVVALWRVFTKAGWPGILAIIPIVNMFILVKVAGYSAWLGLLYFVPIANLILAIIVAVKVGANFGKGGAFSFFLLFLLPFIGYLILGFGDARYAKTA
ncbi:hypothetical protein IT882_13935 [Microbacterium schleiferi]|uniref:Signal peptidase I n=1 Tax=Microbacterium schleiferi TaxID=69362 RepID=A0A7S8MXL5_9MICO|nr:DUF5684 domain-containing protein [Microbacterium schleiferi]QPE04260.1 hypothetical protein IT882_13935 [Microbacterium schleiferi]